MLHLLFLQGTSNIVVLKEVSQRYYDMIRHNNKKIIFIEGASHWLFTSDKKDEGCKYIMVFFLADYL